jgi:hypothetical protein
VTREGWRVRLARWLAPAGALTQPQAPAPAPAPPAPAEPQVPEVWTEVSEQFAWRLLVLTEQLRPALDDLETSEEDPDRLAHLYQIDHGVTRMRRVARDLRILAGQGGEEVAGHTTSLLDVIRMANSSIEHYSRVTIGPVADLAVVAYAADDIASLLAALTDNATRYSPSTVTVGAHLLADGGVMLRVEDSGLGIEPGWLGALNNVLAGPTPAQGVFNFSGRHTGFAVVHRLARRHGLRVQLARREPPGGGANGVSGTVAMAVVPPSLLCEIPDQPLAVEGPTLQGARVAPADARGSRPPAQGGPVLLRPQDVPLPPDGPAGGSAAAPEGGRVLPRREPRSVRTPARQARAAASPPAGPQPAAAPDKAAEGFAFAADLQAFSAGLGGTGPATTEAGGSWPGDAEGHRQ